jgi:hypothetical protein
MEPESSVKRIIVSPLYSSSLSPGTNRGEAVHVLMTWAKDAQSDPCCVQFSQCKDCQAFWSRVPSSGIYRSVGWWKSTDASVFSSAFCLLYASFLLGLLFNPEEGGDIFLHNVRWLPTATRHCITDDRTRHNNRRENLKSYIVKYEWFGTKGKLMIHCRKWMWRHIRNQFLKWTTKYISPLELQFPSVCPNKLSSANRFSKLPLVF